MESGLENLYLKLQEAEREAEQTESRYTSMDMLNAVWNRIGKE